MTGNSAAKAVGGRSKWEDSPTAASPSQTAETPGQPGGGKTDAEGLIRAAKATMDAGAALDMLETGLRGGRTGGNEGTDGAEVVEDATGAECGEFGGPEEGGEGEGGEAADAALRQGGGLHRCREVDKAYQKLNKIDEGTYGVVYRARRPSLLSRDCRSCRATLPYACSLPNRVMPQSRLALSCVTNGKYGLALAGQTGFDKAANDQCTEPRCWANEAWLQSGGASDVCCMATGAASRRESWR